MPHATQLFVAITAFVVGLSHLFRAQDWTTAYAYLHRAGRPGAFANGAIHLIPGAVIVAGHWIWTWPEAVLTILGCLLVAKGTVCFLAPQIALRSMAIGASRHGFRLAGISALLISGWAMFCLLRR